MNGNTGESIQGMARQQEALQQKKHLLVLDLSGLWNAIYFKLLAATANLFPQTKQVQFIVTCAL